MTSGTGARILLVDDDPIILDSLTSFLELEGYEVASATDVVSAIDALDASQFDLVITDVSMPTCDGFELLRHIRAQTPQIMVILMTGYGTIESAVEAMKQGAYEYLTKPIIDDDVKMAVRRALQQQELQAENCSLRAALRGQHAPSNILTADERMSKVLDMVDAVSDSLATVLMTGQSGTGKSMVARAIHARSPRQDKPFVEVACGALPETLLESELFGHVKGAFTHAVADRPGKFASADGGTIFLDEISTATPQLQVKLLRVLQERQFEPVGSNETREVDVRVILATNHDLIQEVQAGRFRSDLYYRINVVNIELPPLAERMDDVPLLAEHFLAKQSAAVGSRAKHFSEHALGLMKLYSWPGNVRELENCVERAIVLCREEIIDIDDLPPAIRSACPSPPAVHLMASELSSGGTLAEALAGPEMQIIQAALEAHNGSRNETARQLGINRTTLYKKMRKYNLLD